MSAELEGMDNSLKALLESQISELEYRIEGVIAEAGELSVKAELLRSIPSIAPYQSPCFSQKCLNSAV